QVGAKLQNPACPTHLFICYFACARGKSSKCFAPFLGQQNDTEGDPNRISLPCCFFDVHPITKWHFLLFHLLYTPPPPTPQNSNCVRLPTQELQRLLACSPPSTHLRQHCWQDRNGNRLAPTHRSNLVTIFVLVAPPSPLATPFRTFGSRTEKSIIILALKHERNIRDARKPCPSPASGGAAAQPKHTGSFVRRTTIEPCKDKREAPHHRTIAGDDSGGGDKQVVRALTLPPIALFPACMRAAGSAIQQCQGLHARNMYNPLSEHTDPPPPLRVLRCKDESSAVASPLPSVV
ncbi:unnamed protein product, partial [Ectocarpus sp. 8 AP-2014]